MIGILPQIFAHILGLPNIFTAIHNYFRGICVGMLCDIYGTQTLKDVTNLLSLKDSGFDMSTYWDIINKTVNAATKPFGIALLTTFFLMYVFDAAAKDQITVDTVIKMMIQLIVAIAILSNFDAVINSILSIGESIFGLLREQFSTSQEVKPKIATNIIEAFQQQLSKVAPPKSTGEEIMTELENNGNSTGSLYFQILFCWLIYHIGKVAMFFAAVARLIELGWRIAFAPIGLANCFEGGTNSPAIRYLKSLFAVAISGAVLFLIFQIGTMVSQILFVQISGAGMWAGVAALLATAGAAIGASNKVKEIIS